jgi:muramoyltetrapeptide carboxypeptidase
LLAATAVPKLGITKTNIEHSKRIVIPPYLKAGDTIGITAPAGYLAGYMIDKDLKPAMEQLQSWGLKVELGKTVGQKWGTFGGTDEQRINDFQYMLNAKHIKAIMCARGGYGIVRIIDKIDFSPFIQNPKWIIGFSDITVFHCHIHTNCHVATLHSKMVNSFPDVWEAAPDLQKQTIISIKQALFGEKMKYNALANSNNRAGTGTGELIGGNLRTIENLAATDSDIKTDGKILLVEDVDEYPYNIDRMFWSLKRTGKLEKLAGLIVGGFKPKTDTCKIYDFNISLYNIVLEKINEYSYPVCFDFPVGHQIENYAYKCGVKHKLVVNDQGAFLEELRNENATNL